MVDLEFLTGKNVAFERFGLKAESFLSDRSPVLREKRGIIYGIVNLMNGKIYVGQTNKTFQKRYERCWWITSDSDHLVNAAKKYGFDNFKILILEEGRGQNILNILETYYILTFKSNEEQFGYNKTTGGNSYRFSPDTIQKMRLSSPLLFTRAEFLEKAISKHGNKFTYDKVVYINSVTNIDIFCNKCGNCFQQTPESHLLAKIGCPKCVLVDASKRYSMPFGEFKSRSEAKYGEEFIYYPTTFTRIHGHTKLTHKKCGNTFILNDAYSHLISKTGCKYCGLKLRETSKKNNFSIYEKQEKDRILKILGLDASDKFTLRQLKGKLRNKLEVESNKSRIQEKQNNWYNDIINKSKEIHGKNAFTYLDYGKVKDNRLHLLCNFCQREIFQKVYDHLNLKRGCSKCKYLNIKELRATSTTSTGIDPS